MQSQEKTHTKKNNDGNIGNQPANDFLVVP
jgi:hypothetical protein